MRASFFENEVAQHVHAFRASGFHVGYHGFNIRFSTISALGQASSSHRLAAKVGRFAVSVRLICVFCCACLDLQMVTIGTSVCLRDARS